MVDVESSAVKAIYNLKMSCENPLRFLLLLIQLAPSLSTLPLFVLTWCRSLGSRGWVLTVQCCLESFSFVCYRRVDVVSHVVILFYLIRVSAILIPISGRTLLLHPKCSEMVTNYVLVTNLQNGSYPLW